MLLPYFFPYQSEPVTTTEDIKDVAEPQKELDVPEVDPSDPKPALAD